MTSRNQFVGGAHATGNGSISIVGSSSAVQQILAMLGSSNPVVTQKITGTIGDTDYTNSAVSHEPNRIVVACIPDAEPTVESSSAQPEISSSVEQPMPSAPVSAPPRRHTPEEAEEIIAQARARGAIINIGVAHTTRGVAGTMHADGSIDVVDKRSGTEQRYTIHRR